MPPTPCSRLVAIPEGVERFMRVDSKRKVMNGKPRPTRCAGCAGEGRKGKEGKVMKEEYMSRDRVGKKGERERESKRASERERDLKTGNITDEGKEGTDEACCQKSSKVNALEFTL